jgi:RES domain-containing protein
MSSTIWTPDALASSAISLKERCWRVVEAQSKVSTMKLTDTLEEQMLIERLVEETKYPVPADCKHLGYLLFTPFRYKPYPTDSRFRRAGSIEGVFYAAEVVDTAVAEAVFHRLLFYSESPNTPWPANPGEYTAFASEFATARAVDLRHPPLVAQRSSWTRLMDYTDCLDLADVIRAATLEVIRYESVRDPQSRANLALLTCRVFTQNDVVDRQTWHFHFTNSGVRSIREAPSATIQFDRNVFAADPRIAAMNWDRP